MLQLRGFQIKTAPPIGEVDELSLQRLGQVRNDAISGKLEMTLKLTVREIEALSVKWNNHICGMLYNDVDSTAR